MLSVIILSAVILNVVAPLESIDRLETISSQN
jgi:hypothetical protein